MILLASRSPRRAELLRQIGVEFRTCSVDIDERQRPGEDAGTLASRLAREKARAGRERRRDLRPGYLVLGADTLIHLDGEVIGKPADVGDCARILERLSGRSHEVLSAVALDDGQGDVRTALSRSRIFFRPLTADEIRVYCASEEPRDKAGAYAIQGKAAIFVERLEGSYSGVMGLPLFETAALLRHHGIEVLS
jgi:septum formation protein